MTIIGADRPGLVELLSTCVTDHGGSWSESRLEILDGQFAGLVRVRLPGDRVESCLRALGALESQGLLDRQIEFLPSDAEISARRARGQGLTRP